MKSSWALTTGRLSEVSSGATPNEVIIKLLCEKILENTVMKKKIKVICFLINVMYWQECGFWSYLN